MRNTIYIITFSALIAIFYSCGEKGPENLWTDRPAGSPEPKILNIIPEGRAGAGVLDIVIQGENFGSSLDQNFVYFNNMLVDVLSANANQLTVIRPTVVGDSITIKIVIQKSIETSRYENYAIDPVTSSFGPFLEPSVSMSTIAADNEGNLYVVFGLERVIRKISPDGQMEDYATYSGISLVSDIHIGPDGFLYLKSNNNSRLYGVEKGGGTIAQLSPSAFFSESVSYIDFDQNGNLYAGGSRRNLNLVRTDNSTAKVANYSSYTIRSVRVYQNYVYVLAENTTQDSTAITGVYRHQITSSDGTLGPAELVLAWDATGEYADSKFTDLTFSADGDMYIATDNSNPILMVSSSGMMRPLYKGILTSTAEEIAWFGTTIYQRVGGTQNGLMWIAMGKEGAPYYGRGK